jgi:hypothetical protein
MTAPLCINCEHFDQWLRPRYGPSGCCTRPVGTGTNLVTGDYIRRKSVSPFEERGNGGLFDRLFGIERCGPEGRFFEPAVPPAPPGSDCQSEPEA